MPTILVVDDDEGMLILIEGALRSEHWNVATTTSGADALTWLRKHRADLLLLDLKLHDMDGQAFVGALAESGRSVPFIIITGHGDERVAVEMMKRGALDYLVKDVSFIEMVPAIVRRAFDQLTRERRLVEAEEALGKSEALKLAVIHSLAAHIAVLDHSGTIIAVNEAWNRFARENELTALARPGVGANYLETYRHLIARGFAPAQEALSGIQEVLSGARPGFSQEYECHVSAVQRWFVMTATPLGDSRGAVVSHLDITERRKAEESLRQSEHRFRSALDNMLEGCLTLDFEWRYLYINEAAARHARRPATALIGRRVLDVFPGMEKSQLFARLQECMRQRTASQLETEFTYPDGDSAWFRLSIQPVPEGLFILSLDITERKKLERELLDISERERRQFGHELHDGLGQRLTGLEMLSHGLAEDLKQHAAELADQAQRLNRELRETVTQARLISHSLAPVPLDGDGLMRALTELAASSSRLPGVTCTFECEPPVRIADVTVATNLYRIAQEAVNNALKHGKARKVGITLAELPTGLEMSVTNNGRTFPRAEREHSGMGLTVMRYRAGVIGANLSIESGKRSGVKVTCTLPKNP